MSDVVGAALSKGEVDLKEGRVYEVAQHYKTLFSRWVKKGNTTDALNLASRGGMQLCYYKEYQSAVGLCEMAIEQYGLLKTPVTAESKERLLAVARCIPPDNASNPTLYKSILGWTTRTTGTKIGDAQVRIAFGNDLWTAGLHQEAQTQFFQGDVQCAERLANIVFEWVLETSELEQLPRFSVRIILQYVMMKKLSEAEAAQGVFLSLLSAKFPSTILAKETTNDGPLFVTKFALLNFSSLLIRTVRRTSQELFTALAVKYADYLEIEPELKESVKQIENAYFPKPTPRGGDLSSIFQSLLGGGGFSSPASASSSSAAELD